MRKKMKRIIGMLLAVCMIASFVPIETYAMVGALTEESVWPSDSSGIHEGIYNKYHVYWIESQYIRMYWLTGTDAVKDKNTYLVTVPKRTRASAKEAYDMVFTKGVYQRPYFLANSKEITYDSYSIQTANDNTWIEVSYVFKPYTQIKKLSQKYTYTVKTKYYIVGLDEGMYSGFSEAGTVMDDESDEGTYGIRCEITAGYEGSVGWSDELDLSFDTQMVGFNRMGHEKVSTGPGLYMSTATGSSAEGYTHTTTGIGADYNHVKTNDLSWWSTPSTGMNSKGTAITEVLTKGYSWANPFTALSDLYSAYVYGHDIDKTFSVDSLPGYFSATKSGNVTLETPLPLMGKERTEIHGSTLWGFRGLRAMDDDNFTPNDKFTPVSVSAKRLGIFKDGSGGYKAIPIESNSAYELAVKLNGGPVAVMRGNFEEKDDRYVFSSPAALSTSITAVWSASKGSFSVGKDGSIELSGVGLNAPSFKFYQDNGGNGLSMQPGENGLEATITPASNSAVMAIDIPGTTIKLEGAVIKTNGDISFTGQSEFSLFKGADFKMEELGYGMKNGNFKINGIRATGSIDSTEMIGLEMGSLVGEIDTFKNYYHFELNLNVFDLFEAEAELELMKSKLTGSLMPNKLYFFVGSEMAKIPLVPPVVVANISGAGGGFNNLAKTLNGDFFAIPPINLTITGRGDVLHTLEAKASYTFGPAYYKMVAEDVSIKFLKKLNLIDEFSIYEGVQGETRSYKGTDYTGLSALGGASVHISVPHKSKVFQAGGDINASVFGGMDSYKNPKKVYVVADMNGGVKGSVHIPEGVKKIGGKKIASTSIDFYLGASSVVNVRDTNFKGAVESAFKNFRIYGGAKKEADWAIAAWRAYYIFPENDAGFTIKGFWDELPEWNWDDHKPSSYSAYSNEEEGTLMLVGMNMDPLVASVVENDEDNGIAALSSGYSKTVTLKANMQQALSSDATVILMVTPDDGTDIDAFAESLTVSKDGQPIALTWPKYNENEEIINESSINAMVTTNGNGKDCLMIGLGKNASVGDDWLVTSSIADFQASLNASMPFDSLDVSLSGYDLSGKVANAEADTEYVLATYFGSKKGETEYIIGHEDMNNPNSISVTIPREGTMLPTGNYYVTASLMRKAAIEVEDDEGNITKEEILLPVDTKELGSVSYRNTAQPDAPSTAEIKPIGNEIMNASWSEVKNADGYKVTIYQKNGDTYEDTGKGYSYDAADIKAGKINGIAYDVNSKEFTLDMALTVSGEDIDVNKELQGGSTGLEADKNYKIGVQAYKYLTEAGEKIENSQVYSKETLSNDSDLPAYTPLDINIALKTLKGSGPSSAFVAHTVTEEDSVFTCVTGGGDNHTWYVTPSCDAENVTFTVTRMDTDDTYTPDSSGAYYIDNEEIIGSVMFKIDAAVNKGTYTDITTKYLLVEMDDTAPMFSLDETVVFADPETGAYTITGLTEPNMRVCLNEEDYYGNPIEAATADETGKFSYTGRLELTKLVHVYDEEGRIQVDENDEPIMVSVPNESSKLVSLLAEDENGNRSAVESASVTVKREVENYTVTLNTNGGTISSGKELTSYTGGQGALLPNADNITRAGYTFMGWYDNEALTGDPVTLISTSDTGEKSYWAKWEANAYTVNFDSAGGTEVASKTTAKWNEAVLGGVADPTRSGYRFDGWKCGNITVTAATTYSELVSDDTVTSVTLVAQWKDVTAPTGEIKVSKNSWKTFLNKITFGLFFKDTQDVIITAADNSGDTVTIEYLLSDKEVAESELGTKTFTAYNGNLSISPNNEYVIYAKLTDASGNVTYINSDGIVLDSNVPVISGVENGKTYCSAQTVTVTEKYIESVTVNGNSVTLDANNQFTLSAVEGPQTIVVTDKVGNSTTVAVTVNNGHIPEADDGDCTTAIKCGTCGEITTAAKSHDFTGEWLKDETQHWHECRNEGCNQTDQRIDHFGVDDGDCTTTLVCECGTIVKEAETAHNWNEWTKDEGADTHTRKCQNDGCKASETESCTGGKADCQNKATCSTCNEPYGELDTTNHTGKKVWTKTQTQHEQKWDCCGAAVVSLEDHELENGVCKECGYVCLYTVNFDSNGGSFIDSKTNVKWSDMVLNNVSDPTYNKTGYEFIGWTYGNTSVTEETTYGDLVDQNTLSVTLKAQWKDINNPTGEISIATNKWTEFLNNITFGLFFKDTQTVTINASDNSEETVKIEYLLSDKELTADELDAATFSAYTGAFGINPDNKYVIYAKLTDASGNVTYINSDGIVLDSIVPGISGVENGKTYCSEQTVTITEKYIESVTLNGNPVTPDANNQFTLSATEGEQKIVVTDKAGNTAEVTVTVNEGHTYEWQSKNGQYWKKCQSCGDETVKKDIPNITISGADTVCVTQDYKFSFTLPEGATDASYGYEFENKGDDSLEPTIENGKMCAVIPADIYEPNENSFKVYAFATTADGFEFFASKTVTLQSQHIDAEPKDHICDICGVTVSEHIDAEPKDHICDICGETLSEHTGGEATCKDKAVCEYCGNEYGELDSTKHNLEKMPAKDATVTEVGNKEYWHCKVCENNFSDEDGKNSIELKDTEIAKLSPEIIDGTGQSVNAGDKKDLTFRSNAAFSDFIRVDIDGNTIDGKNYTTEEGSTIVTLKANYVATLSAGEHTIGIVSQSGTATTTFTVAKAQEPTGSNANNPTESNSNTGSVNHVSQTGDNSHMALWVALLLISGGLMTVMCIYGRKKKHSTKKHN